MRPLWFAEKLIKFVIMKNKEIAEKPSKELRYNPELNQYTDKVLFPKKVEYAKQILKKAGLPKQLQK